MAGACQRELPAGAAADGSRGRNYASRCPAGARENHRRHRHREQLYLCRWGNRNPRLIQRCSGNRTTSSPLPIGSQLLPCNWLPPKQALIIRIERSFQQHPVYRRNPARYKKLAGFVVSHFAEISTFLSANRTQIPDSAKCCRFFSIYS